MSENMKKNDSFFNFAHSIFVWIISFLFLICSYVLIFFYRDPILRIFPRYAQVYSYYFRVLFFLIGIRVQISGQTYLYENKKYIVFSNHGSLLDIPVMYITLKRKMIWLAKKDLFSVPILGNLLKKQEAIAVERETIEGGWKAMVSLYKKIKGCNDPVCIFPEGTRSHPSGRMRPFKEGSFSMALFSKSIIQPITIQGSNNLMYPQKKNRIQRIRSGRIVVTIHPPLYPKDYADKTADQLSDHVREVIMSSLSFSE